MSSEQSAAREPELTAAELRDALGDIMDVLEGYTRPMTAREKLAAIRSIANKAWEGERG